jgi:hypothetical protein
LGGRDQEDNDLRPAQEKVSKIGFFGDSKFALEKFNDLIQSVKTGNVSIG